MTADLEKLRKWNHIEKENVPKILFESFSGLLEVDFEKEKQIHSVPVKTILNIQEWSTCTPHKLEQMPLLTS